ncbi:hypothetical protein QJS66_17615 [Kocuria rhizophila]|nr:hypothetical protein QJS66_17615 [Kocuria rhizophila]
MSSEITRPAAGARQAEHAACRAPALDRLRGARRSCPPNRGPRMSPPPRPRPLRRRQRALDRRTRLPAQPDSASQEHPAPSVPTTGPVPTASPGSAAAQEPRGRSASTADDAARTRPCPAPLPRAAPAWPPGVCTPGTSTPPANPVGDNHLTTQESPPRRRGTRCDRGPPGGASPRPRVSRRRPCAPGSVSVSGVCRSSPGSWGCTAAALGALLTALAILAGPAVGLDTGLSAGDALARGPRRAGARSCGAASSSWVR